MRLSKGIRGATQTISINIKSYNPESVFSGVAFKRSETFGTFISRDDAFSQCQTAWLLFPPTAPFALHLQQIWSYPKRIVAHFTLAVLSAPKKIVKT